jgi:putative ABC transport system substrate-binding protein
VNVIVGNSIAALAAKAATATVPIVFVTGADPVKDGLVESLNRPGRNVTGVTFLSGVLGAKRLELLRQIAPQATTIAALVYPHTTESQAERRDLIAAAQSLGQQLLIFDVSSEAELEPAFAAMVQRGVGAVLGASGAFLNTYRDRVTALALRHALPSGFSQREFVTAGGLMSYGTSITDAYRQAGNYTGRILKGEKPGDLPVLQPTKFEFVLNLKTAKTLGLNISLTLQAAADEVIE